MTDKENTHRYDDIIDLPHHVSRTHPQMSMIDRAAQFSPFAALTGYEAAIRETGRLTDQWSELDESRKSWLDEKLRLIAANMDRSPEVRITYFLPDERKSGGSYVTAEGCVKKIDGYKRQVLMSSGAIIPIDRIYEIEGRLFECSESV